MSAFSKKNMIFCPFFPRKYAAKVQQKNQKNKQILLILHKLAEFSGFSSRIQTNTSSKDRLFGLVLSVNAYQFV